VPAGEFMAGRLRQLSGDVAGDLVVGSFGEAENKINRLLVCFQIAQEQKWIRPLNWWVLGSEYRILKQEIFLQRLEQKGRQEIAAKENPSITSHNIKREKKMAEADLDDQEVSDRQNRILQEIKKKRVLKISYLIPLFKSQASERTLRNDLQFLIKKGLVGKRGDKKSAAYCIK